MSKLKENNPAFKRIILSVNNFDLDKLRTIRIPKDSILNDPMGESNEFDGETPLLTDGLKLIYDTENNPRLVFFGSGETMLNQETIWFAYGKNI